MGALLALALVTAAAQPAIAQTPDPWALMADRDLVAIHDLLARNHPGPVDPQNPGYRAWLEDGLREARTQAVRARSHSDYVRTLRFYTNGFRDGHIAISLRTRGTALSWPGFHVRHDEADGRIVVASATPSSGIPGGSELVSCDGRTPAEMSAALLEPYYWNRDIPHARWNALPNLFIFQRDDRAAQPARCDFRIDGTVRTMPLNWSTEPRETVIDAVFGGGEGASPGLRRVGDIWFVTLPGFNYFGEGAAPMRALIADMERQARELRAGTVVFDVRGNEGGNSEWGDLVAKALWGQVLVDRVAGSFDWTVDWRVSPDNVAHLTRIAERSARDGMTEGARSWGEARDAMQAALARGEALVRRPSPATPLSRQAPPNPVSGRVFLLTDGACASACLDFADLVRRLPNARHIGLPTSADAIYIDNTLGALPSGLADLSYSLKVYRNRVRGNNQWYTPQVVWPGGEMTDEALARWISGLD